MAEKLTKAELVELLITTFENLQTVQENMDVIDEIKGEEAIDAAALIHRQFEPFTEESEGMIVGLLSEDFCYDGVDYKNDLEDKDIHQYAEDGLVTYLISAVSDLAKEIDGQIEFKVVNNLF